MPFPPFAGRRTVRWRPEDGDGLEHLTLAALPDGGVEARSVVISPGFGACYRLRCGADWRVTAFEVSATDGRRLALRSPAPGRWQDADGQSLAAVDGCVDLDFAATPFTNTLPIRRLAFSPADGPVELRMLYVSVDTLVPQVDAQRYTALPDGRHYRYEAADGSFAATLAVDADGLVLDYPALFRRA